MGRGCWSCVAEHGDSVISYLKGNVVDRGENWLLVEAGGIGYKVFVPAETLLASKAGEAVELFCHHHFSQDSQALYGFTKKSDLELFEMIISISGIGPKSALSILSKARSEEIEKAIRDGDAALFTAISGVGKKRADHIILELRPKLGLTGRQEEIVGSEAEKVWAALQNLGYRRDEVAEVIKKMPADLSSDSERIKWVLRNLYR